MDPRGQRRLTKSTVCSHPDVSLPNASAGAKDRIVEDGFTRSLIGLFSLDFSRPERKQEVLQWVEKGCKDQTGMME